MITFKNLGVSGRLGNQLFQLSTVMSLAWRNSDTYLFPTWEYESHFNLHNCFTDNKKIIPNNYYHEPHFHYKEIPNQNTQNEVLDLVGYYQSYKYFEEFQPTISSLLTPTIGYGIKYGVTSIHIRRGDYLTKPDAHPLPDMNYYYQAMNLAKTEKYMIFSDDIRWCKNNFRGPQYIFAEDNDPVTDLSLQLSCEHNIISNSTFGWWAGYLNKNPSKIVIAPQRWFGPKLPHDTKDLLPPDWIKI